MAREVWAFAVSVPAGTPKATPQVTALVMPPRTVSGLEVQIPPGPRGEVGFQLGAAGNQIIPASIGQFLVSDDEVIHWPLENQIDSGAWQAILYNTGSFPHTITFRLLVDLATGREVNFGAFTPLVLG